jgi:GNAT superfamily N-acetyltransferase
MPAFAGMTNVVNVATRPLSQQRLGSHFLKGETGMGLFWYDGIEDLNDCLFDVSDVIERSVEKTLEDGLTAHAKASKFPPYEAKELCIVRRGGPEGAVVAGLTGKTFWNWLYIDMLWVDDALRGQGVGSALMQAAEQEAKKRGCVGAYLWTESFQGEGFYPKLGYKEFVRMDDFPIGHQRIGFMKRLAA